MAKVILVCGKICAGKTRYCQQMQERTGAVLLSCDEIMYDLFHHREGKWHDEMAGNARKYLHKKAAEIVRAGCDVILDWGFWSRDTRQETRALYEQLAIEQEWHYIDISDEDWKINIDKRNQAILDQKSTDYYMDDGLKTKLLSRFQAPDPWEIDVWQKFERQ